MYTHRQLVGWNMNEYSSEVVPMREDAFPPAKKGYDKRAVDDYVRTLSKQNADLRERLHRSHDELERMREELAGLRRQVENKPEHEQVSERMTEILRLAEEDAKEKRAQADREIEQIRSEAKESAQKLTKDAQAHADRVLGSAREQAQELVGSAKQETEQLRGQAQQEAERQIHEAEQRAQHVNDSTDARLTALTATHGEAVRRLNDMRDTLAELLKSEQESGPLDPEGSVTAGSAAKGQGGQQLAKESAASRPATGSGTAQLATKPQPAASPQPAAKPEAAASPQSASAKPEAATKPEATVGQHEAPTKPTETAQPQEDPAESTVRISPKKQGQGEQSQPAQESQDPAESTVRISPKKQSGPQPSAVRNTPQRSGGQTSGDQGQAPVTGGDPGITGVYQQPTKAGAGEDSGQDTSSQDPGNDSGQGNGGEDEGEGVRIVRP